MNGLNERIFSAVQNRWRFGVQQPSSDTRLVKAEFFKNTITCRFAHCTSSVSECLSKSIARAYLFQKIPYSVSTNYKVCNKNRLENGKSFSATIFVISVTAKYSMATFNDT